MLGFHTKTNSLPPNGISGRTYPTNGFMFLFSNPAGIPRVSSFSFVTTLVWLTTAVFLGGAPTATFVTPEPHAPVASSHFSLEWTAGADDDEELHFELRQSGGPDFADPRVRYEGPDRATFLAGLPEGDHYFQIRAKTPDADSAGPWSDSFHLTIQYQSLTLAWFLFGVGAVVFLATLVLVVAGSTKARREEKAETTERGAFSGPS